MSELRTEMVSLIQELCQCPSTAAEDLYIEMLARMQHPIESVVMFGVIRDLARLRKES